MIATVDYRKALKELYNPPVAKPVLIDVPPMDFFMVDGRGNPNSAAEYREAVEALYTVAYTLKFMLKKEEGQDYPVPPLEGLWWAEDMADFMNANRDNWQWTMMILQPVEPSAEQINRAIEQARAKKKALTALDKLRYETFYEGTSAQIMHIGPYSAEGANIARLHAFIWEHGYALSGKHHEIYISDPRRVAPEKMKTVVRQPVSPAREK